MLKHTVNKMSSLCDFVVVVARLGTGAVSQVEKVMRGFVRRAPQGQHFINRRIYPADNNASHY
jgi:hypothetical protein